MTITRIQLATGTLTLNVEPGRVPIHRLLGFAARIGSKRKFLLVSKVLGKHYPVKPKLMAWSYRTLARQVLKSGAGHKSVWIGMAETATGLGYGVYAAASAEGLKQGLFMQTTRYHLAGLEYLAFDEAHSHATDFFLYYPEQTSYKQQFLTADTLVLIDDEISTGRTFLRLIMAYQSVNPDLKQVFIVSLVNFASAEDKAKLQRESGVSLQWVSLRQGQWHFDDAKVAQIDQVTVNVSGNGACKKHLLAWPGRLGMNKPVSLEPDVMVQLNPHFRVDDQRPVLVLGTGECNAPAYLLGCVLEKKGFHVKVQSTTRSPIYPGNDIKLISRFEDNYEDGIPNFIYNLDVDEYREIIVCHETPLSAELTRIITRWQAISARLDYSSHYPYAKLHFSRP